MIMHIIWKRRPIARSIAAEERGQALVETAASAVMLLLLLAGAAEFGSTMYAAIEVQDAAKAGAQYGTQNTTTVADTTGIATAAANNAVHLAAVHPTSSYSCICSDGSASTCKSTDCSSSHMEYILTVKTQSTFTPIFCLPGLPSTFILHGQAVQKVLQ
jgi:Flp pilus assembly protein TadG